MIKELLNLQDISLKPEHLETVRKAILVFGKSRQLLCFVEELGELLTELSNDIHKDDGIIEEIVDVILATETIKILYGFKYRQIPPEKMGIETAIGKTLMAISHFDRYRISEAEYNRILNSLYASLSALVSAKEYSYSVLDEMLDKKFAKFDRQLKESLNTF